MPRANEPSSEEPIPAPPISPSQINATRYVVSTLGGLLAIGGFEHGVFETLQGDTPTPGLFIHSIGPHQQMWPYGTEDAFTLIPNFLLSGLVSIALSLLIAVWSIRFVHRKHGSTVFLLLFILLFISGGGVAQVVFFTLAWAVSLRIHKPAVWPDRMLSQPARVAFGNLWLPCLVLFTVLSLAALEIAIAGYVPGIQNPNLKQHICWSLLLIGLSVLLVAIASGRAHDRRAGKVT